MTEIAILSGKGGTGKTSISAALSTLALNTVMADCDVDAANLHLILQPNNYHEEAFTTGYKAIVDTTTCTQCGLCHQYCRFGAISTLSNAVIISETSCDGCMLCARVCPNNAITMVPSDKSRWYIGHYRKGQMVHARLWPGEENSGKLVNVVREQARNLAVKDKSDYILIDGPPGTGCPVISSVTGVQKALIVTEPTGSGFHDLKRIIELVQNFNIQTYVLINKFDLNASISQQIADWCSETQIPLIGRVPFDARMVEAMVNCQSIIEWAPQSDTSTEIRNAWRKLIDNLKMN